MSSRDAAQPPRWTAAGQRDATRRYRFHDFVYDADAGELIRGDQVVRLAPQPARALTLLLERAGTLVSRELLRDRLWSATVVEFDQGLNFCIREVRSALGDRAAAPRFVETLPRRGYRFMAPVEVVPSADPRTDTVDPGPAPPAPAELNSRATDAGEPRRTTRQGKRRRLAMGLGAAAVIAALALVRGAPEAPDSPAHPRAGELAEFGRYLLTRGEGDDVSRSVEYFRQALALDPDLARAYGDLGTAYLRLSRPEEGKAALRHSLELDSNLWPSHLRLALHALYVDYDRGRAAAHFRRAVRLAPDEVAVRHTHAWFRALQGDSQGALAEMHAALALDPVSPRVRGDVGRLFYLAGRHDEAVAHCRRTQELQPRALRPRDCIVHALWQKGALEEARREARTLMAGYGVTSAAVAAVDGADSAGLDAYWRWAAETIARLAREGRDSHVHAAAAWARLRETDRALEALEAAYTARCPVLPQIALDPAFASLRDEPRFQSMLRRIRVPTAAPASTPASD